MADQDKTPASEASFTDAAKAARHLRQNVLHDIQRKRIQAAQVRLSVAGPTTSVTCTLVNRNEGRATMPALWKITAPDGRSCNALAPAETIEEFFVGCLGEKPQRYVFAVGSEAPQAPAPARQEKPPAQPRPPAPESFGLGYLLQSIHKRFGVGALGVMYLAVENDDGVQGFVTVQKSGKRYSLVDEVLNRQITLSNVPHLREAVIEWLRDDFGVDPMRCTFRIAQKEEKDAYEVEEIQEIEVEEQEAVPPEAELTADESHVQGAHDEEVQEKGESAPEAEVLPAEPEKGEPQKPRQKRKHPKNRPKKKTRAQEKARAARVELETYTSMTSALLKDADKLLGNIAKRDQLEKAITKLVPLGSLRGLNKSRLRKDLSENVSFEKLRLLLSMFRHDYMVQLAKERFDERFLRRAGERSDSLNKLSSLAHELFPDTKHGSPYQNADAYAWIFQKNRRDLEEYRMLLFPESDSQSFLQGLTAIKQERWVDLGSGQTPANPSSLISLLPILNSNIEMIGIDPAYSEVLASDADKLAGRVGMNFPENIKVRPGTAQDIPLEDKSVDRVISLFAFDKFNDSPQVRGTQQALREIARILKPGGQARLVPIRAEQIELRGGVIEEYFDIEARVYGLSPTGNSPGDLVVLRRKPLTDEKFERLCAESNDWKKIHAKDKE